jgi:hypothetical protein
MHAEASPSSGSGGGARHIALGVRTTAFPIDDFINAPGAGEASINASSLKDAVASLDFYSNPDRRGGEWTIRNQYSQRHPAWSAAEGFPTDYDSANPPYVLVFRSGDSFQARFANEYELDAIWEDLPANLLSDARGIAPASPGMLAAFGIPVPTLLGAFEAQEVEEPAEEFDPENFEDGRRQVFASIIRRQGQPAFRQMLFNAYDGQCAITRSITTWVLEAAHITPYKGVGTNTLQNGLLLRADVHTMFDLGLISVEPADRIVKVSSLLHESEYWSFNDTYLLAPKKITQRPSSTSLQHHFSQFRP